MARVKICGLTDEAAVAAAVDAGADWVGFVLVAASPRAVTPARAGALAEPARGRAKVVAVVSDAPDALMSDVSDALAPDVVQLHGGEAPGRIAPARALTHAEIWKALGVRAREDLDAARMYADADALLLDAKPPHGADRAGGHGARFDWALLADWTPGKPWLLSGGLNPENVGEAVRATGAAAVDVSSGVESAPGVKDIFKIKDFIAAAKSASAQGAAA